MQSEEWDAIPIAPLDRVVNVAQNSFDYRAGGSRFAILFRVESRAADGQNGLRGGGGQRAGAVDARTAT